MQFIVHAYDYADALERRLAARPAHLEGVRSLKKRGEFILGGALLSSEGQMIGSMMLMEFPSREELDVWLGVEPYVTNAVWERIEVNPFRMAVI